MEPVQIRVSRKRAGKTVVAEGIIETAEIVRITEIEVIEIIKVIEVKDRK